MMPGAVIAGRDLVLGERGAMGLVLYAQDPRVGREVAIKLLAASDAVQAERSLREAQAAAQLRHPHSRARL